MPSQKKPAAWHHQVAQSRGSLQELKLLEVRQLLRNRAAQVHDSQVPAHH